MEYLKKSDILLRAQAVHPGPTGINCVRGFQVTFCRARPTSIQVPGAASLYKIEDNAAILDLKRARKFEKIPILAPLKSRDWASGVRSKWFPATWALNTVCTT